MHALVITAIAFLAGGVVVRAADGDPCGFFDVEIDRKYRIRTDSGGLRATRTYPFDDDPSCVTNGKYMSLHTEILNNTNPNKDETGESLYIATFASPVQIAKYTTIYDFSIVEVTPKGFKYKVCYKSTDPLSGKVDTKLIIAKDYVMNIRKSNLDDGTSVIGQKCEICPDGLSNFTGPGPATSCGPPLLWDGWSSRKPDIKDCYPMVSPNLLVILPVCTSNGEPVSSVQRFRSFACRETSDTGYRVSSEVSLTGTAINLVTCFVGNGA